MNGTTFPQNKLLLEKTVTKIFFSMKLEIHRQNNIEKKATSFFRDKVNCSSKNSCFIHSILIPAKNLCHLNCLIFNEGAI